MNSCKPRLVVIGSVDFSNRMLKEIILAGGNIVGVVAKASMGINSDFCDISVTAQSRKYRPTKLMTLTMITRHISYQNCNRITSSALVGPSF